MYHTIPLYVENDYEAMRGLIPDLPLTFGEWARTAAEQEANPPPGRAIQKVVVHSDEYQTWCRSIGQECNYATLGAFATQKATRESQEK